MSYVALTSLKEGVSMDLALYVARKESGFDPTEIGDLDIFRKGKPVRARGLWQITEYYHQDISDEQAFDVRWSTNWAMKYLKDKKLCTHMFSTCKKYYNSSDKIILD